MALPIDVFVCYVNEDEALRDALGRHLGSLKRQGVIREHDQRVLAGEDRDEIVAQRLASARMILLLVSADLLASYHLYDVAIARAIERERDGKARVVPIFLRPCDLRGEPIAKLQGLPRNGKPVTSWASVDEALTDVALGVREVAEELLRAPAQESATAREPVDGRRMTTNEGRPAQKIEAGNEPREPALALSFDSLPETQLSFYAWSNLKGPLCFNSLPTTRLDLSFWTSKPL